MLTLRHLRLVVSSRCRPLHPRWNHTKLADDPFPFPLSSEILDQPTNSEELPPRIPRENEPIDVLRARLVYQSRKRGMLEGDLLLSTFAAENLPRMSLEELKEFDRLMDEPDWDIYYWSIRKKEPPARWANSMLLQRLRVHTQNKGKVVRKMPNLDSSITAQ